MIFFAFFFIFNSNDNAQIETYHAHHDDRVHHVVVAVAAAADDVAADAVVAVVGIAVEAAVVEIAVGAVAVHVLHVVGIVDNWHSAADIVAVVAVDIADIGHHGSIDNFNFEIKPFAHCKSIIAKKKIKKKHLFTYC